MGSGRHRLRVPPTTTTTTAPLKNGPAPPCSPTTSPASGSRGIRQRSSRPGGLQNQGKYIFQKMGIPLRQITSWDYSGPYHGYDSFAIFARDMDMALSNPCWNKITPPWKKKDEATELPKAA